MLKDLEISKVNSPTSYRERILQLHRASAATLGLLPFAAFDEYIQKRQILLAVHNGELLGYLLYRTTRGRATIVHLCVDQKSRGGGVATALVAALKFETKSLEGIALSCRRDYGINDVWAKFGFEAVLSKPGRGKDAAELTHWWFSHGHSDLFSLAAALEEPRTPVVIDANVFFDFNRETENSASSKALLEEWVQSSVELLVTKELRNEIDKNSDPAERKASLALATRFNTLPSNDPDFQARVIELKQIFAGHTTDRDQSDLRQIAYALAGGASYFVTRDENLIERCETLYASHGLWVLHPAGLLTDLDSIEREQEYKPAHIAGSNLRSSRLTQEELDDAVDSFKKPSESRSVLLKLLRNFLSQPKQTEIQIIRDGSGKAVILGVTDRSEAGTLVIPLLRWASHPLASTMQRNFLRTCLDKAAQECRNVLVLRGDGLSTQDAGLPSEFGFLHNGSDWIKAALRVVGTASELTELARQATGRIASISGLEDGLTIESDDRSGALSKLERRFWPAKISNGEIPSFLVTILPGWAQHFFDDLLGSQLIFGLRDDLHLGVEGVYYRKAVNNNMTAPGRVLWYVSKGGTGDGSMTVKACSQLEEVIVGKPKDLFKRFQRLGVYEWRNVYETADKDINTEIMAFRFRMTERFTHPVDTAFLDNLGVRPPFMSPRKLTDEQFCAIYRKGMAI